MAIGRKIVKPPGLILCRIMHRVILLQVQKNLIISKKISTDYDLLIKLKRGAMKDSFEQICTDYLETRIRHKLVDILDAKEQENLSLRYSEDSPINLYNFFEDLIGKKRLTLWETSRLQLLQQRIKKLSESGGNNQSPVSQPAPLDLLYSNTPIHAVLENKAYSDDAKIEHITTLIHKFKCNVDEKNLIGATPLHSAASDSLKPDSTSSILVSFLLQQGADVNAKDNDKTTPLAGACGSSTDEAVKIVKILCEAKADVSVNNDHLPLLQKIYRMDLASSPYNKVKNINRIAGILLDYKADINQKGDFDSNTVLHAAIRWNNLSGVVFLLSRNADPNSRNEHGETPAHFIGFMYKLEDQLECLLKLKAAGADLSVKSNFLTTPLDHLRCPSPKERAKIIARLSQLPGSAAPSGIFGSSSSAASAVAAPSQAFAP